MFSDNARTFSALLRRDIKILRSDFLGNMFDCLIRVAESILLIGYLLPLLGLSHHFIAPLFLQEVVFLSFDLGFGRATQLVFDVHYNRFIDYHLLLPISKVWLFTEYITIFIIRSLIITLPVIAASFILLGSKISFELTNWWLFALMYLLILLCFAIFFHYVSFSHQFDWFINHVWPRRFLPMIYFSAFLIPWKPLNKFSPTLGKLFLCNPMTYLCEGLRSALLGPADYIPYWICVIATIIIITLCTIGLIHGIKKRLDPV